MKTYNEVAPTDLGHNQTKRRKKNITSQSSQAKSPSAPEAEWPESLLQFVNKSFKQAEALNSADKKQFKEQILQLIYLAAKDEKIWTNPWDSQTLPIFDKSVGLTLIQDAPKKRDTLNSNVAGVATKGKKFDSQERKNERSARFSSPEVRQKPKLIVDPNKPIVGTLEALEKRYLRLTSAPDPSTVRPEHVLEKCLAYVTKKFKTTNKQYLYINDQLKAIRQDLTVQHIKNEFAMKVYEHHGRIAIENNDLGEFNQCLSQLRHLYSLNNAEDNYQRTYEFQCYQVLYFLVLGNNAGINAISLELLDRDSSTDATKLSRRYTQSRECLYKAIELLRIMTEGNYYQFFLTYAWFRQQTFIPCAFAFIDKFLVTKERVIAMHTISKAYKKLHTAFLIQQLRFEDQTEFVSFCQDFGLDDFIHSEEFDCGAARLKLQAIVSEGRFKKVDIKGQV